VAGGFVIKLGGSAITDKSKPYTVRLSILHGIAAEMAEAIARGAEVKGVVVGGGSFGHYVATAYSEEKSPAGEALSSITASMTELALAVHDVLQSHGINTIIYPPHAFCRPRDLKPNCAWHMVSASIELNAIPLVYGDAYPCRGQWCIVSGDELSLEMACSLGAEYVAYLSDVDGILDPRGNLVTSIELGKLGSLKGDSIEGGKGYDVTGGINRKLRVIQANWCSRLKGIWIINGTRLDGRLVRLLVEHRARGTLIAP